MNEKLYTKMKAIYAEFSGAELAEVIGVIRKEIQAEQMQQELENKIVHFTKELEVVKKQRRELRD
jgi:hypothetical protein